MVSAPEPESPGDEMDGEEWALGGEAVDSRPDSEGDKGEEDDLVDEDMVAEYAAAKAEEDAIREVGSLPRALVSPLAP